MSDALLNAKQKTALFLAAFLPVACIFWGQLGAYLQYPQGISSDHLAIVILVLLFMGPLALSILCSLGTFAYVFFKQRHEGAIMGVLILAHFGVVPWALYVGRQTIF